VPKLYSSQEIVKALEREGFVYISQRGSHVKYRKTSSSIIIHTVIVPAGRKQVPRGTCRSILRQSSLDQSALHNVVVPRAPWRAYSCSVTRPANPMRSRREGYHTPNTARRET
jgi:predicted RNA binding protein YcfA (HicA-like mRNA interferase family)